MDPRSPKTTAPKPYDTIEGFILNSRAFQEKFFPNGAPNDLFKNLISGQSPKVMLMTCCDSRIVPSDIFGISAGDVFMKQTIGAIIPPNNPDNMLNATAAALEFAVTVLNVKHIILMGHSKCGGIQALINNGAHPSPLVMHSFINTWVSMAESARKAALEKHPNASAEETAKACEEETLCLSLNNLLTYPWIASRVRNGELSLHAWRFDLGHGMIQGLNPHSRQFEDLVATNPNHQMGFTLPKARL